MDWNTFALPSSLASPFVVRFVLSALILLLGIAVAKTLTTWIRRAVRTFLSQEQLADSPLGEVFQPAKTLGGSGIFSTIVYAFILFLFLSIAGEMLGITFFAQVVALILSFVPNLAAALVVLAIGVLLSGIVERVVRQQTKRFFPEQARFAGTIASSSLMVLFVLMAFAELGIAQEFILILFAGVVFSLALAFGLSFGLGARSHIESLLSRTFRTGLTEPSHGKKR